MLTWLTLAFIAGAQDIQGRDEFGRECTLRLTPTLAARVEGEWYDHPRDQSSVAGPGGSARVGAALVAVTDGVSADFELHLTHGRPAWFTLTLRSATGYVHACRLP